MYSRRSNSPSAIVYLCLSSPILVPIFVVTASTDMISDNDPIVSKFISIPKDVSQLNCGAFMAGIVEAIMDGCQFVSSLNRGAVLWHKTVFPA